MFKHTQDPKGQIIKTVGQLFKEFWHLRKIESCLLANNYCTESHLTNPPTVISDCWEYIDVRMYGEDGEPLKESPFLTKLEKLEFEQHDWLHCYPFKSVYVGDGKYLLLDYHVKLRDLLTVVGVLKKDQQRTVKKAI